MTIAMFAPSNLLSCMTESWKPVCKKKNNSLLNINNQVLTRGSHFQIEPITWYQLFEAWVWQRTMVGSCIIPELSAGLEALSWAKAASVSGNAGGVAGVLVGTHDACYKKQEDETDLHTSTGYEVLIYMVQIHLHVAHSRTHTIHIM